MFFGACASEEKKERQVEQKPREIKPAVNSQASCGSPNSYSFSATLADDTGAPVKYRKAYVYGYMVNERSDVKICENSDQACSFVVTSGRSCTSVGSRAVFYLEDGSKKVISDW